MLSILGSIAAVKLDQEYTTLKQGSVQLPHR